MRRILQIILGCALAASCALEPMETTSLMGIEVSTGDMTPETRGTLIGSSNLTSLITSISLYIYKESSLEVDAPTVTTWDSTNSKWTISDYYWNPENTLDIFARAPFEVSNATMGNPTITNSATNHQMMFKYTIPNSLSPSQMPDILLEHVNQAGSAGHTVSLTMDHALTAVEFVTGKSVIPMTINTITLAGIRNSETCTFKNDVISWSATGSKEEFSFSPAVSVSNNTENNVIASGDNTFIFIPQTFGTEDVTLSMNITPTGLTSQNVTCKLPAATWEAGKKNTYKVNYQDGILSISSVSATDWVAGGSSSFRMGK